MSVLLPLPATLAAQDFRIESEVFIGQQKEPVAESLTLFRDGVVYDFLLSGPEEITILDPQRQRFVLLNVRGRVRATLSLQDLRTFAEQLKQEADSARQDFFINPQFEERYDETSGWLTLTSRYMVYRAKGMTPQKPDAVAHFQQFADWYARLNATRRGGLPPFARIELDKALNQRQLVPEEVELTIIPKNRLLGKKVEVRSRHLFNWELSRTDRARIEKAGEDMASFEPVSFQQYRDATSAASGSGK